MKHKLLKGGIDMEQKYILGIVALAMVVVLGIGAVSAFGFGKLDLTNEEREAEREAVKASVESGDYEAWKSLMEERIAKMQEGLTEEKFNELVERHSKMLEFKEAVKELKASGDFSREDIDNLRVEYGVEGQGFKKGFGMEGFKKGFGGRGMRNSGSCPFADSE